MSYIVIALTFAVLGFAAGYLVARKNAAKVDAVVAAAKTAAK